MLPWKPQLERTTRSFFHLDSALYALFSVHSNLHPFTEINYTLPKRRKSHTYFDGEVFYTLKVHLFLLKADARTMYRVHSQLQILNCKT